MRLPILSSFSTRRWLILLAVLWLSGCAGVEPRPDLPMSSAIPLSSGTVLDDLIGSVEALNPGASGFRLIVEGPEAFAIRGRSALVAGRSLDVQTYIWHDDATGAFLAYRLLEAADRGVKVRLLVDDLDARSKDYSSAALDFHPNIEVRIFNPFKARQGTLAFAGEFLGNFDRANRRMHNKTWIADNRIAVVGGRNLGNEYFGASDEVNFVDLDFAMTGPIVREASASFDRYWNSALSYPMELLVPEEAISAAALDSIRSQLKAFAAQAESSRFADELRNSDAVRRLLAGDWPLHWTSKYKFISDDPRKALGEGVAGSNVLGLLVPVVRGATRNLTVISPYFIPGQQGTDVLVERAQAGTAVKILTNSLSANDVAAVYGGYTEWRTPLLEGGVKLWELKPQPGSKVKSSLFGSSGASLHTKALTADGTTVFVGSFNLDPRSASLNTEQGIFVEDAALAAQLESIFKADSAGAHAWSVTLNEGKMTWSDGKVTTSKVPGASAWKKFQAWLAGVLPIDSHL